MIDLSNAYIVVNKTSDKTKKKEWHYLVFLVKSKWNLGSIVKSLLR